MSLRQGKPRWRVSSAKTVPPGATQVTIGNLEPGYVILALKPDPDGEFPLDLAEAAHNGTEVHDMTHHVKEQK